MRAQMRWLALAAMLLPADPARRAGRATSLLASATRRGLRRARARPTPRSRRRSRIAILRPDLYDVDRLLASTATYALASPAACSPIFTAVTSPTGLLLGGESAVVAVVVTALRGRRLAPLRTRLQRRVDRRLYPVRWAALAAVDDLRSRVDAGTAPARRSWRTCCARRCATRTCASGTGSRAGPGSWTPAAAGAVEPGPDGVPVRVGGAEIGLLRGTSPPASCSPTCGRGGGAAGRGRAAAPRARQRAARGRGEPGPAAARGLRGAAAARARPARRRAAAAGLARDGAAARAAAPRERRRRRERAARPGGRRARRRPSASCARSRTASGRAASTTGWARRCAALVDDRAAARRAATSAPSRCPTTSRRPPTTSPARRWPTPSSTPAPTASRCGSHATRAGCRSRVRDDGRGGARRPAARPGRAGRPGRRRTAGRCWSRSAPGARHDRRGGAAVRVVIGEDSALFREGLARLLGTPATRSSPRPATPGARGRRRRRRRRTSRSIDIRMPPDGTDDGARAARRIRDGHPDAGHRAAVPARRDAGTRSSWSASGRFGYLLKDRVLDVDDFLDALRRVAAGGSALDPEVVAPAARRPAATRPARHAHRPRARGAGADGGGPHQRRHRAPAVAHRAHRGDPRRAHPRQARPAGGARRTTAACWPC